MKQGVSVGRNALILADSGLASAPDARWLQPQWWTMQGAVVAQLGGRGTALRLNTPVGPAVLRRYLRGGWMAPLLDDRYLRCGAERSRGFVEFRLLGRLRELGLPVPEPLAASFEPAGLFYRAGLLTRLIPDARSLAELAAALSLAEWRSLAELLRRCFQAGLMHPDLNAHNLLLDSAGRWHVLDFDRARLNAGPVAGRPMIERLQRSLHKHAASGWQDGFERELRGLK